MKKRSKGAWKGEKVEGKDVVLIMYEVVVNIY